MINKSNLNKVSLFIPDDLSSTEADEVFDSINVMLDNTMFHCSFYRTMEEDLLEYLLKLPDKYHSHFTIHFVSSHQYHDESIIKVLDFLMSKGLKVKEHNLPVGFDQLSSRQSYTKFVDKIVSQSDEVLTFYRRDDHQIGKLMHPVDVAATKNKRSYINYLDGKGLVPVKQ